MLLEIDYGNTRLKWRLLNAGTFAVYASGHVVGCADLLAALQAVSCDTLRACRVCSVRKQDDNAELSGLLENHYGIVPVFAQAVAMLAGVRSGYLEAATLGVDRWLAIVAAYKSAGRACLVLDFGTAITADYIDDSGLHLGGCIAPGYKLMSQMLKRCGGLVGVEGGLDAKGISLGESTQAAVQAGIQAMLVGFIKEALVLANQALGEEFEMICTGGDAAIVSQLMPKAIIDKDLVFQGLAFACPYIAKG